MLVHYRFFFSIFFFGTLAPSSIFENADLLYHFRTLRLSAALGSVSLFLLAQTYNGVLPGPFEICAFYLVLTGISGAAAYLCALDSQNPGDPDDDGTYEFLLFLSATTLIGMSLSSFVLGPLEACEEKYSPIPPITDQLSTYPSIDTMMDVGFDDDGCSSHPTLSDREEPLVSGFALLTHPVGQTMFVALFVSLGIGYVYLASIGQILLSLPVVSGQSPQHARNIHVSIFSLCNCASRAFFGTLSDLLKNKFGIHRLWVFWSGIVALGLAQLYLVTCVTTASLLVPCTVAMALVYGLSFGIAPAATAEFGTSVFARNWGILLFAPALGSQLFNVLFGALYDKEAERQGVHVCQGPECFRETYWIGIVTVVICFFLMTWTIFKSGIHKRSPVAS
ncbi:hypothetical protein DM01DRAFT_264856 [Hesseltinella vesiculosa]|uniref:MFS general substrate transporter n=1 Tax=Hesseltinella vesiculosa TaxID=101127 RepID=A0A1X2G5B8_9FUNG|nr:hypothetical protein DM01DRAFT_264856 [Hesseltinella vesiculosa]